MIHAPEGLPPSLAGLERTCVFGVLNVTPDSFSDGGRHDDVESAVAAGIALRAAGADLVDVGGESTRPGAARVEEDVERQRVLPVVEALAAADVPVSIDTMRAGVAADAVAAGACLVNDVSGGLADPQMLAAMAEVDVPYVVMHWRGHGWYMDTKAVYRDVVADVVAELRDRLAACEAAGIDPRRVVVDPGLGFAKRPEHNWALLAHVDQLSALGHPLLVGASRKRFLGALLADESGPRAIPEREAATTAVTALLAARQVWAVRVHNVRDSADAVRVAAAWQEVDA
ncbi:MAG: dihydropteroate synthase [Actinobacteria bacterium]|nr:dihydropteroate synthase [Actinomycetota bacterium]MCB9411359.1 dihydropteroate synthase [Actinomycetota bacterium]